MTGSKPFDGSKQLCRSDVLVCENGLLVQFRWSKTIHFGGRVLLVPVLAIPNSPLYPQRAFVNMLKLVPAQDSDPAFGLNVGRRYHPISYEILQKFIKSSVARLGLDPGLFSSHSLRRAGASWAFKAQVPGELIKIQGDLASETYLHYLEFSLSERCQVAQRMTMEIMKEGLWNVALPVSLLLQVVTETGANRFAGEVYQGPWCQGQGLPRRNPDTAGGSDPIRWGGC